MGLLLVTQVCIIFVPLKEKKFINPHSLLSPPPSLPPSLPPQYFDMLNVVGNNPSTNTIFVPHKYNGKGGGEGGGEDVSDLVRDGVMQAQSRLAGRMTR